MRFRRLRQPVAIDVAIAPVGHQDLGFRGDVDSGHHGEIAARRAAGDHDLLAVEVKLLAALASNPAKAFLHVFDDGRQLDLGSEAIIQRHQGKPFGPAQVE